MLFVRVVYRMKGFIYPFLLLLTGLLHSSFTGKSPGNEGFIGPEKGHLVIAGGGSSTGAMQKLIALTRKPNPKIVIVTSAEDDDHQNPAFYLKQKKLFQDLGMTEPEIFHTRNLDSANSRTFTQKIFSADAVWFTGGRQWRLADSYLNTLAFEGFKEVLRKGGVLGGTSAGATIMGSFLVRGDTRTNQIMEGDHTLGFGFVSNTAIDQHVLQRNRHFDLLEIRAKYPMVLGIGIDEGTFVVVNRNRMDVYGNHYVAIFDGTFWRRETNEVTVLPATSERFYFLKNGDHYDLLQRKVVP